MKSRSAGLLGQGANPDSSDCYPILLVACIGGGSNAIGPFWPFLQDEAVKMIGVEAGGRGLRDGDHAA